MTSRSDTLTSSYQPLPQSPGSADASEQTDDDVEAPQRPRQADGATSNWINWIHFMLGSAVLLPWNALITATPFFLSRLKGSQLQSTFSSYLSITFTLSNFCFLAHATVTSKRSSPSRRSFISTSCLLVLVFLLLLSTGIQLSPNIFFTFVIINGIAQACAGSYLQNASVVTGSLFGSSAMQALMTGQAFVGVVVSAVQLFSAAVSIRGASIAAEAGQEYDSAAAEAQAAAIFFGISTLFLVATLGAETWLVRLPEYKASIPKSNYLKSENSDNSKDKHQIVRVAKMNVGYEFAVAYVFVVTLAVFPPITTSIVPTNPKFHPFLFNALHFLVFNLGDLTGRYICAVPKFLVWSSRRLVALSLARTLFIPLFLLCNIRGTTTIPEPTSPVPGIPTMALADPASPFINSDFLFFLILLLFGISNGYLSSMCMIAAPSELHNPRLQLRGALARADVDTAATLANFFLIGGLVVGSAASFAVRAQVCKCNPFTQ